MKKAPSAYDRALNLLTTRAHSRFELRRKLRSKHGQTEIDEAMERLARLGLLDDRSFAIDRAHILCRDRAWGERRIAADLSSRGLSEADIQAALAEAEERDPSRDRLMRLIDSRVARRGTPKDRSELKRVFDRCIRLGYAPSAIREELAPYFAALGDETP